MSATMIHAVAALRLGMRIEGTACVMLYAVGLMIGSTAGPAQSASATWNGSVDSLWSNVNNWDGPPASVPSAGDMATFNGTGAARASIDTTGGIAIKSIIFEGTAAPYTIGAQGAIQLDPGGNITLNPGLAQDQAVSAAINIASGSSTHSNSAPAVLSIYGNITGAAQNMFLNKAGSGEMVLAGNNWISQNADYGYSGKVTVMDGGTLTIAAGTTYICQIVNLNRGSWSYDGTLHLGRNSAGGSSGSNTVNVTGSARVWTGGVNLGSGAWTADNANGHNTFNLSATGSSTSQTFRDLGKGGDYTCVIGDNTGFNVVNISNGAYFEFLNTGAAFVIGRNSGGYTNGFSGCENGIDISGTSGGSRSTFSSPGSRYCVVGGYGSNNYMKVSAGASISAARLNVGEGGNYNYLFATNSGSTITLGRFCIGGNAGTGNFGGSGSNNYVLVSGGARFTCSGGSNIPNCIGGNQNGVAVSASYNYIQVDGLGSTLTVQNNNAPLTIGGCSSGTGGGGGNVLDSGTNAVGNHLKVSNGGYAHVNSVYLVGSASRVVVGEGDENTAQMEVRADATTSYSQGIYLAKSDARVEINNGRLVAGQNGAAPGAMVSGAGRIDLLGPAYFSTSYSGSSIGAEITGSGPLIKEDTGTLALSATNTYTGNTIVSNGVLRLTHTRCLDENAVIRITSPGTVDLAYEGRHKIKDLIVDGVSMGDGIFGAGSPQITCDSGKGFLIVGGMHGGALILR